MLAQKEIRGVSSGEPRKEEVATEFKSDFSGLRRVEFFLAINVIIGIFIIILYLEILLFTNPICYSAQ